MKTVQGLLQLPKSLAGLILKLRFSWKMQEDILYLNYQLSLGGLAKFVRRQVRFGAKTFLVLVRVTCVSLLKHYFGGSLTLPSELHQRPIPRHFVSGTAKSAVRWHGLAPISNKSAQHRGD